MSARAVAIVALLGLGGCRAAPQSRAPGAPERIIGADGIPVAMSPASLLAKGAVPVLKQALQARGLLPKQNNSDELDDATERAIGEMQRRAKLPVTGLPNYETVAALGIAPQKVFLPLKPEQ